MGLGHHAAGRHRNLTDFFFLDHLADFVRSPLIDSLFNPAAGLNVDLVHNGFTDSTASLVRNLLDDHFRNVAANLNWAVLADNFRLVGRARNLALNDVRAPLAVTCVVTGALNHAATGVAATIADHLLNHRARVIDPLCGPLTAVLADRAIGRDRLADGVAAFLIDGLGDLTANRLAAFLNVILDHLAIDLAGAFASYGLVDRLANTVAAITVSGFPNRLADRVAFFTRAGLVDRLAGRVLAVTILRFRDIAVAGDRLVLVDRIVFGALTGDLLLVVDGLVDSPVTRPTFDFACRITCGRLTGRLRTAVIAAASTVPTGLNLGRHSQDHRQPSDDCGTDLFHGVAPRVFSRVCVMSAVRGSNPSDLSPVRPQGNIICTTKLEMQTKCEVPTQENSGRGNLVPFDLQT